MTALMLWMSGSSVQIFSIMITILSIFNPVKAIMSINAAFVKFEDSKTSFILPKLLYIFFNVFSLSMAVYKCWSLGLLPTTPSDWLSFYTVKEAIEFSGGGISFIS